MKEFGDGCASRNCGCLSSWNPANSGPVLRTFCIRISGTCPWRPLGSPWPPLSWRSRRTVLFPRTGCEQLLAQLFGFGVEAHDDLVDGFSYLLQGLVDQGLELPKIHWIDG